MRIIGLTMITAPDVRQDPWRESLEQALHVFDEVVVVCGAIRHDYNLLDFAFGASPALSRLHRIGLEWPQPEWSFEELPKHLNFGLGYIASTFEVDWVVRFDIDCFIHENDRQLMRNSLQAVGGPRGKMAASFEKYQFLLADRCYEKGKIPLALNMRRNPHISYGKFHDSYSDLCQPMRPMAVPMDRGIPVGLRIPDREIAKTGVHVWNYDYTFKTAERSKDLLYHFDRSHAKWWGQGFSGLKLEEITPDSAFEDFLKLSRGRIKKATKRMTPREHPGAIRERIAKIRPEEFGHSGWGLIK